MCLSDICLYVHLSEMSNYILQCSSNWGIVNKRDVTLDFYIHFISCVISISSDIPKASNFLFVTSQESFIQIIRNLSHSSGNGFLTG